MSQAILCHFNKNYRLFIDHLVGQVRSIKNEQISLMSTSFSIATSYIRSFSIPQNVSSNRTQYVERSDNRLDISSEPFRACLPIERQESLGRRSEKDREHERQKESKKERKRGREIGGTQKRNGFVVKERIIFHSTKERLSFRQIPQTAKGGLERSQRVALLPWFFARGILIGVFASRPDSISGGSTSTRWPIS